ncbi:MAG: hypothetical protein PHX62_09235, partial [Bacilli bacterium]|nr:hypothetical protein [Bacilli bacterium]
MTKGQIEKIYEKYCYNKQVGEYEKWEETLNKIDDETIKKIFTLYGNEISDLSSLENRIIKVLPKKEGFEFLGYKDLEDMKYQIGL